MNITQRSMAAATALCFTFLGVFAAGMATGTPAHSVWHAQIENIHQIEAVQEIKQVLRIEAALACDIAQKAREAAAEALEKIEI